MGVIKAAFSGNRKSQTGVEYIILFGVLLFLLVGVFVYTSTSYTNSENYEQASDAVRTLAAAADKLYAMEPGTKTFVYITLPEGIIASNITIHEISVTIKTSHGETDAVAGTNARVEGSIPKDPGIYKVQLLVTGSGIVLIGTNITGPTIEEQVPPVINFTNPTPADGIFVKVGSYRVNVSVTDNGPITSCTLHVGTTTQLMTMVGSGNKVSCNTLMNLPTGGTYTYYVTAVDNSLNEGISVTRTITVPRRGVKEALMSYTGTNAFIPAYRTWDKVKWSNEQGGLDAGAQNKLGWFILTSNPLKDEKAVIFRDRMPSAQNPSAFAEIWDGANWATWKLLTNWNSAAIRFGMYDAAYEQQTGKLVVVYSDINIGKYPIYTTRDPTTGVWSPPQKIPNSVMGDIVFIKLAANPKSNEIIAVVLYNSGLLNAHVWNPGGSTSTEVCDGVDNDGDSLIDENLTAPLAAKQAGVCAGSKKVCAGGLGWVEPDYAGNITSYQAYETLLDGLDNDCDSLVDSDPVTGVLFLNRTKNVCEGSTARSCGWIGAQYVCLESGCAYGGMPPACFGTPTPCPSITNSTVCLWAGIPNGNCKWYNCTDTDGDGYGLGDNACAHAETDCNNNNATIHVNATELCDSTDNDCDFSNNEGLANVPCPLQAGVCAGTKHSCTGAPLIGYSWAACTYPALIYESTETKCSDGLDNDCNGLTDCYDPGCYNAATCKEWAFNTTIFANVPLPAFTQPFDVAYEQNSGRAIVTWQEPTVAIPGYRIWQSRNWSDERLANQTSTNGAWFKLASRQNSNQLLLAIQDMNGFIWLQFWNGTSWGAVKRLYWTPQATGCSNPQNFRCFDAAFEQISIPNRAIVAYDLPGGATIMEDGHTYILETGCVAYSLWNGTKWVDAACSADVFGSPDWVELDEDIYSDEMFLTVSHSNILYVQDWYPELTAFKNITGPLSSQAGSLVFSVSFDKNP